MESGASKVWPGFLQEGGRCCWTGHHSSQPHSQLSRHSAGEVQRTDTGGADGAGQLRPGMTDGSGGKQPERSQRAGIFLTTCSKPSEFPEGTIRGQSSA